MNKAGSGSTHKNKATDLSYIDFLWDNGMDRLGQGWYGWENGYRWTQTMAVFYLSIPSPHEKPERFFCIEGYILGNHKKTVELAINGHLIKTWFHDPVNSDKVRLVTTVPSSLRGGFLCECALTVSKPYIPNREEADSGDERALGMFVKKMGVINSQDGQLPKVMPGFKDLIRFYVNEMYKRAIRLDRKYPGNWISIYNFRKTQKALSSMPMPNSGNEGAPK